MYLRQTALDTKKYIRQVALCTKRYLGQVALFPSGMQIMASINQTDCVIPLDPKICCLVFK